MRRIWSGGEDYREDYNTVDDDPSSSQANQNEGEEDKEAKEPGLRYVAATDTNDAQCIGERNATFRITQYPVNDGTTCPFPNGYVKREECNLPLEFCTKLHCIGT